MDPANILEVRNLCTYFQTGKRSVHAVEDVSFVLRRGEMLGIVGESGSGKSVTARSVLRIIKPPGKTVGGEILFDGIDLLKVPQHALRRYRGKKMAMIFQEPLSALNPSFTIGWQIEEAYRLHEKQLGRAERQRRVIEMLEKVKIPDAPRRAREYPHQFSGGMRQRALIAMALACGPELLFADEPTTALDVTVQADIMDLLAELRRDMHLSVVLISHNMNLVAQRCERIMVMYAGRVVETATSEQLLARPAHPYTEGLLRSIPDIESDQPLISIPGEIADVSGGRKGCVFCDRCVRAMGICAQRAPKSVALESGHICACHLYSGGEGELT